MPTVVLSPIGGAGEQFFNNNGAVLTGGKIYTYAAGTTTPLTTYTTSAGTVANANPVVLNSAGRVGGSVWLIYGASYKFVIQDSLGNVIDTQDNISGSSAAGGLVTSATIALLKAMTGMTTGTRVLVQDTGFYRYDSTSSTTAVSYLVVTPDSGGGRWFLEVDGENWRPYANVKQYGAVGDGVTADYTALAAAITAGAGGVVFIPAGTYLIATGLSIPANTIVQGVGTGATTISYSGAGQAVTIAGDRAGLEDIQITGTGVNNPTTDNGQTGVRMSGAANCTLKNVRIYNVGKGLSFVNLSSSDAVRYNTYTNLEIRYCYRGVTTEEGATSTCGENAFFGGRISACYNNVYLDAFSGDVRFFGVCIEGNTSSTAYLVDVVAGSRNAFIGCRFEETSGGDKTVRVQAAASGTTFLGCYDGNIEDFSSNTVMDWNNGLARIATERAMSVVDAENLVPNGDLKGNLRTWTHTSQSLVFNAGTGLDADCVTLTPSAASGNSRIQFTINPVTFIRKMTATVQYKRDTGGTQEVRWRVGTNGTATIANYLDSSSSGVTTMFLTFDVPAGDTTVNLFIYGDQVVGTGPVTVYRVTANWGAVPCAGAARVESSAAPTVGVWKLGEIVWNNAAAAVPVAWICTVAGTPGTFAPYAYPLLNGSVAWNPASIPVGAMESKDITVTGAVLGDFVRVSMNVDVADLTLTGNVTAADTVTAVLANNTSGAVDIGAGTVYARVEKK